MEYTIEAQPTYAYLELTLNPGESVVTEGGAMAWMSPGLQIQTSTRGGIMAGLTRSALTGESFLVSVLPFIPALLGFRIAGSGSARRPSAAGRGR